MGITSTCGAIDCAAPFAIHWRITAMVCLRQRRLAQRHLPTDGRTTLQLLNEIAVVRIARGHAIE